MDAILRAGPKPPAPPELTEPEKEAPPTKTPFLYCLNFLNNLKDDTVRRGAVVRSLAVCTRHNYIHIYKPFILLALQRYYANPSEEVLADLFASLNGTLLLWSHCGLICYIEMDTDKMPMLNYNQKLILRSTTDRTKHTFATSISYMGTKMNVQLPLALFPDEVGDVCLFAIYF